MAQESGKRYTDPMPSSEPNPTDNSIRALAGDGKKHRMDDPTQKAAVDALLNLTPAELAARVVHQRTGEEAALIRLMVERSILNPAQCDLLSAEFADLYGQMKLIDAQRKNGLALVQLIVRQATGATRQRINEILLPRENPDGSWDTLA